jgi:hypothetical protein
MIRYVPADPPRPAHRPRPMDVAVALIAQDKAGQIKPDGDPATL